jgi:hypothetical protein
MTERDELTEYLVDAATDGIIDRQAVADTGQPLSAGKYARAAVAAALREMTKRGWHLASDDGNSALHPEGMAREIERRR